MQPSYLLSNCTELRTIGCLVSCNDNHTMMEVYNLGLRIAPGSAWGASWSILYSKFRVSNQ